MCSKKKKSLSVFIYSYQEEASNFLWDQEKWSLFVWPRKVVPFVYDDTTGSLLGCITLPANGQPAMYHWMYPFLNMKSF